MGNVQAAPLEPAVMRRLPGEDRVPLLEPVEALGLGRPERVGIVFGFGIDGCIVGDRGSCELVEGSERPPLLK